MALLRFGDLTVEAVADGHLVFDPAISLPDVPFAALSALGGIEHDRWVAPLTTWAIRAGERLLLVDTGLGPSVGRFEGTSGELPAALARAGIDPARVDAVIFTHLHPDHVGWNFVERDGGRAPTFANARYIVHRVEWEHWSGQEAGFLRRSVAPLAGTGQLDLVTDDHEIVPGVRLLGTPGHTPGHVCVLIADGGEGGVITGDAAHHPAQLEHPEWSPTFDADREQAARSRATLADRLERDGLAALGGHFPAPHAGHLIRVERRRVYRALGTASLLD
jgi:glyoxylase-like metal-dependent hydrolase (beta-lactamase superfamily II)